MRCARSYQDIKTPEDEEQDWEEESEFESLLQEFDPEEAAANGCSYEQFRANCRRMARNHRYGS